MNHKNTFAVVALITTSALVLGSAVLAAPAGPPPTSNLPNANFNTVNINTGSGPGLYSKSPNYGVEGESSGYWAGVYGLSQATGVTGDVSNATNQYGIGVYGHSPIGTGVFGFSEATSTGLDKGVYGIGYSTGVAGVSKNPTGGSGGSFSGNTGVSGSGRIGAIFQGANGAGTTVPMAVFGYLYDPSIPGSMAASFSGLHTVNLGTANYSVDATDGRINAGRGLDTNAYDNTTDAIDATANSSTNFAIDARNISGTAIYARNSASLKPAIEAYTSAATGIGVRASGNPAVQAVGTSGGAAITASNNSATIPTATITNSNGAVTAAGLLLNGDLDMSGDVKMNPGNTIYAPTMTGGVRDVSSGIINDSDLSLVGKPDVNISASSGQVILVQTSLAASGVGTLNSVTVKDPQGLMMQNYTTGVASLNITQDGELGNLTANPVTLRDDQGMSVKNTFATSTLMSVDGSGYLTALNGIGRIYKKNGTVVSVPTSPTSYYTPAGTVSCNAGDRIISCGIDYSASGWVILSQVGMSGTSGISSCNVYASNQSGGAQNSNPYAMCFSSNGTW